MNNSYLFEKVKKGRALRFFSNCYSMTGLDNSNRIWEDGDSFLFSFEDHGVNRLQFYVENYSVLSKLLAKVDPGKYCFEIMTKNPDEFMDAKVSIIAKMLRMSNADCSSILIDKSLAQYKDDSIVEIATTEDTVEINSILWNTFNTEVSHLLSDEELKAVIENKQVFVHRSDKIDAILQADIKPKKFYINQVINKTEKNVIHAIVLSQLEKYIENGGKYLYAWVDETNIASVKFHKKYGMQHDGMWNIVYCLER